MKAVILAGGKGTRLQPITCGLPKPMVPVMNIPLMEHIILLLKKHGIVDIGVTLMYMPQKISSYFADGSKWGVRLTYFTEESPCGTAGSLLHASSFLDGTFIVVSGDCITDMNLTEAIEYHRKQKALATLVLTPSANPSNYGIAVTDNNGRITRFLEKPSRQQVFSNIVNTGTYILEPEILQYIERNRPFDFSRELIPKLLQAGVRLSGYQVRGYWSDVGSVENYLNTHSDILEKNPGMFSWQESGPRLILIGKSTVIEPTAVIKGPCVIGDNCYIGRHCVIDSFTVIGSNCILGDRVFVKRSILHDHVTADSGCELQSCVVGSHARLMPKVACYENAVIGDQCIIRESCVIRPGIRIWPGKTVDR